MYYNMDLIFNLLGFESLSSHYSIISDRRNTKTKFHNVNVKEKQYIFRQLSKPDRDDGKTYSVTAILYQSDKSAFRTCAYNIRSHTKIQRSADSHKYRLPTKFDL